MLKRNHEGLYYVSDTTQRMYYLHKGTSLAGEKEYTDDVCYIMDSGFTEEDYERWMNDETERTDDNVEKFVDFFYGATFLEKEDYWKEYGEIIKGYIDEYENKKMYLFNNEEIIKFCEAIEEAALEFAQIRLDLVKTSIQIRVGDHSIIVPQTANNYIGLYDFLLKCREDTME